MSVDLLLGTTFLLQVGTFILTGTFLYLFFFTPLFQSMKKGDYEIKALAKTLAASGRAGFYLIILSELIFTAHYFLMHDFFVSQYAYFARVGFFVLGCTLVLLAAFTSFSKRLASFLLFITSLFYFFTALFPTYIATHILVFGLSYGSIILLSLLIFYIKRTS